MPENKWVEEAMEVMEDFGASTASGEPKSTQAI
jgi:hypothetical protein